MEAKLEIVNAWDCTVVDVIDNVVNKTFYADMENVGTKECLKNVPFEFITVPVDPSKFQIGAQFSYVEMLDYSGERPRHCWEYTFKD